MTLRFWEKNEEDEKLAKLIKNQPNFFYAKKEIKFQLLASLPARPGSSKQSARSWIRLHHYGVAFAAVILAIGLTSTLAYADSAKPGDKLFGLDRAQEEILIKLVPSHTTKAKLRARLVKERAIELEKLTEIKNHKEIKVQAIEQSVKGLTQAIESVNEAKVRMQKRGKIKNAEELNNVLNRLENLADEHEQQAHKIRTDITDPNLQQRIDVDLRQLQEAKIKAGLELNQKENVELKLDNSGPGSLNQGPASF